MNDILRAKTYAMTKEGIATGVLSDAASSAMVPEVYQQPRDKGGWNMEAPEAHRIVSLVALGKATTLFRMGNRPHERAVAIEYLAPMIRDEKASRLCTQKWRFAKYVFPILAAVAIDELCWGVCPTCKGARQVPMSMVEIAGVQPMRECPTCFGDGKRRHRDGERIDALAKEWVKKTGTLLPASRKMIRGHRRLRDMFEAVEWGKSKILEAERIAVEMTAVMVERWRP